MSIGSENIYFFGEFRLDTEQKMLWQSGKAVSLPPKIMDILCLLVEKQGKVVSKNEIMETVWADSFVEESNLTQSIYTLRRTLGNDESGKSIIETVPRRGFRISIPVSENIEPQIQVQEVKIPPAEQTSFFQKNKIILGALIFTLCAGLILALAYNSFFGNKPSSPPIENVLLQKLTFTGDISNPVISPDGKSIAFVRQNNLYLQDVNTGSSVKLNVVDHNVFGNLQFSLNGETIYFRNERRTTAGGDVFQVSRFGGTASKILENSWSGIGISPDGKNISFVRLFPNEAKWVLFRKDLQTGEEKSLFERVSPDSIYRTGFPAWSPDGKKIVTVSQEKPASTIYVIDSENGSAVKQETPRFVQIEQTVWSADGNAIFIVGREKDRFFQLWKMNYPSGELQRITNDLSIYRHISISADGKNLIAEKQSIYSHLWLTEDEKLNEVKQLTSGNLNRNGNAGIAWTPDGNIVYTSRISGDVDIWQYRLKDGVTTQLTKNSGLNNENPSVSADGKFVYFESTRTVSRHIWRIDIDGSNPTQITFSEKENEFYPVISKDVNTLYFLKKSPQGNVVLKKNLAENKVENITKQGEFAPDSFLSLSPDGKKLAFNNLKEKKEEESNSKTTQIGIVYLEEENRVELIESPQLGGTFHWTEDGKSFEYLENSPEGAKIFRKSLEPNSVPKLILETPDTQFYQFAWSFDHKYLAIARGKQERDAILLKNFE